MKWPNEIDAIFPDLEPADFVFKKIPGPQVGYVDLLDHETRKEQQEDRPGYFPLRPSAAGYCTRRLAYSLNAYLGNEAEEKEEKEPSVVRLLDLGGNIEHHIERHFRKCSKWFKIKYRQQLVELFPLVAATDPSLSFLIEGSMDGCFVSDEHKAVVDYKTKKEKFSRFTASDWAETDEMLARLAHKVSDTCFYIEDLAKFLDSLPTNQCFFADNFYQLNSYACSDFLRKRGIDHAAIIQYNKNTSQMREIRFRPSMEVFERVRTKFQNALDAVGAGDPSLAPKDYALGSMRCGFCPYKSKCWPDEDALKAYFATWPKKQWPRDLDRIPQGDELAALFAEYERCSESAKAQTDVEQEIVRLMDEAKEKKIRLTNGNVYELKYLKSAGVGGKGGLVIRRGKA